MAKIKNNGKSDYLGMIVNDSFLEGQLELYKIEFSETGNNKYLDVMNRLNITLETINKMDEIIQKLSIENKELKK